MKQRKINTADFLCDLMDNLADIWRDEIIKDGKLAPGGACDTARFINDRMGDFDDHALLVRVNPIGSEFFPSTQGFRFELLGSNKVSAFETFNEKPASRQDFEQFLLKCLDEIRMIPNTRTQLDEIIVKTFTQNSLSTADLEVLLDVKHQLIAKST